jgi:hypothetical protein
VLAHHQTPTTIIPDVVAEYKRVQAKCSERGRVR